MNSFRDVGESKAKNNMEALVGDVGESKAKNNMEASVGSVTP